LTLTVNSEVLSFGINPEIELGISEGLEFTWEAFQYPGVIADCRKSWNYTATLRDVDAKGNFTEVALPLWIRFDEINRSLILMPHAKTEAGTFFINL